MRCCLCVFVLVCDASVCVCVCVVSWFVFGWFVCVRAFCKFFFLKLCMSQHLQPPVRWTWHNWWRSRHLQSPVHWTPQTQLTSVPCLLGVLAPIAHMILFVIWILWFRDLWMSPLCPPHNSEQFPSINRPRSLMANHFVILIQNTYLF